VSVVAAYPRRFASLVKIEHTVFALPFAYVGAFLAVDAVPSAHDLVWITVAMVGARSLAMALNRLIDAEIDARNPRTAGRELPAGRLSRAQVILFCLASLAVFLIAVWQLDPICRWLWPIPVAGFVVYPYLKRVTWLAHLWLGAVDGLAPMGAWIAIRGDLPWQAWALGGAVACWVAGFDLFYSLFDAGKTTLLRLIAGLLVPTAGELDVDAARERIGFLGHEPLVYRELTALENLDLYGRLYRVPERRERMGMLLERFGLWEARNQRAGSFSRGMLQRLALCRTLLHEPELLVLDEPYSALDEEGAALLDRELGELRANGTFVVSTHDPARLERFATQRLAFA
jgi:ABC-type transport system involved in cytochrome c biogenesis ATPase subunit